MIRDEIFFLWQQRNIGNKNASAAFRPRPVVWLISQILFISRDELEIPFPIDFVSQRDRGCAENWAHHSSPSPSHLPHFMAPIKVSLVQFGTFERTNSTPRPGNHQIPSSKAQFLSTFTSPKNRINKFSSAPHPQINWPPIKSSGNLQIKLFQSLFHFSGRGDEDFSLKVSCKCAAFAAVQ